MDRTKKQLVLLPAGTFLMNIYLMASVHTAGRPAAAAAMLLLSPMCKTEGFRVTAC